jgi:hypothetical protein
MRSGLGNTCKETAINLCYGTNPAFVLKEEGKPQKPQSWQLVSCKIFEPRNCRTVNRSANLPRSFEVLGLLFLQLIRRQSPRRHIYFKSLILLPFECSRCDQHFQCAVVEICMTDHLNIINCYLTYYLSKVENNVV